jgi:methyl-accepting chemotaxis protein
MTLLRFGDWRIRHRLLLLIGLVWLTGLGIGGATLALLYQQALDDRVQALRWVAETVSTQADVLAAEVTAGKLTRADALKRIAAIADGMQFSNGGNYIAMFSTDGVMLSHRNRALIGTNRRDAETAGIKIFRLFREGIEAQGFTVLSYLYPVPGQSEPARKLAFAIGHKGLGLVISTGAQTDDIAAEFRPLALRVAGGLLAALMALGAVAWMIGTSVTKPLAQLNIDVRRIVEGDLQTAVSGTARKDEVGQIARAVQVFRDQARENQDLHARHASDAAARQAEKQQAMTRLADDLRIQVGRVVDGVATGAREADAAAHGVDGAVAQVQTEVGHVSTASAHASANVQTVAAAAEELVASIGEVNAQVSRSAGLARDATTLAARADENMKQLAEGAQKIGAIVAVIDSIAGQTNLLALNATIEAARAGEAGKGFAVVASEVKQLATQTARATEEIRSQIGGMQGMTVTAVEAIGATVQVIQRIDETATAIAGAVEEQHAATQEIVRNMQQAAGGTDEVSEGIAGIGRAMSSAVTAKDRTLQVAGQLATQSDDLKGVLDRFVADLQAA